MLLVPPQDWWLLLVVPLLFGTYTEGMLGSFFFGTHPTLIDHPDQEWLWQKLDHFNPKCTEFWRQVLMYELKHKEYHANISTDFRLCDASFDSEEKTSFFLDVLMDVIGLVQYGRERPLNQDQKNYNFDQKMTRSNNTLNYFCRVMTAKSLGTPYERYAYYFNKNLEADQNFCLNVNYDDYIKMMRNTEWDGAAASGLRQWVYQTCTEFGFFQTTDSKHQPFLGLSMSYYIDKREKVFDLGIDVDLLLEYVKETNKYYYEPFITTGRRILFPNGDLDPWHALSINSRKQRNLIGISIKNSYHCEAMFENHKNDAENLKAVRRFILKTLLKWLPKRRF